MRDIALLHDAATFVYVAPLTPVRWVVATDDVLAPAVSEHETCAEALAAARAHAVARGIRELVVHEEDGEERSLLLDEDAA